MRSPGSGVTRVAPALASLPSARERPGRIAVESRTYGEHVRQRDAMADNLVDQTAKSWSASEKTPKSGSTRSVPALLDRPSVDGARPSITTVPTPGLVITRCPRGGSTRPATLTDDSGSVFADVVVHRAASPAPASELRRFTNKQIRGWASLRPPRQAQSRARRPSGASVQSSRVGFGLLLASTSESVYVLMVVPTVLPE